MSAKQTTFKFSPRVQSYVKSIRQVVNAANDCRANNDNQGYLAQHAVAQSMATMIVDGHKNSFHFSEPAFRAACGL